jgi:hypothetical protein
MSHKNRGGLAENRNPAQPHQRVEADMAQRIFVIGEDTAGHNAILQDCSANGSLASDRTSIVLS